MDQKSDRKSRKSLPHVVPLEIPPNPMGDLFFITISCKPRGRNQLANPEVWGVIIETLLHREKAGILKTRMVLAMPDHLHGLFIFVDSRPMIQLISDFKSWVAKRTGIVWQRDFFDHRLRSAESSEEKASYIRQNPVRAGLVENPDDWPYQWHNWTG
jgi:REP element-mobilizing transposase RayT